MNNENERVRPERSARFGRCAPRRKRKPSKRTVVTVILVLLVLIATAAVTTLIFLHHEENMLKDRIEKNVHHTKKSSGKLSCVDVKGYVNIALLGVDSRDMSEDALNHANSDCIMIMSINTKTNKITLTSVYRDTYLHIRGKGTDKYGKINSALSIGGPECTMRALNEAMDLNIKEYVLFNFKMVANLVDSVGGITVDVKPYEIQQLNKYTIQTAQNVGKKHYKLVTHSGKQTLEGVQAVSYGRIRKGVGDDFKRTSRMRLVLTKVAKKLRHTNLNTLNSMLDSSLKQCETNMSSDDMLLLAKRMKDYKFSTSKGFPYHVTTGYIGKESFVFPSALVPDVRSLHRQIFNQDDYHPTDSVYREMSQISAAPIK
jgi:LCP family protein required for cell wall assembly